MNTTATVALQKDTKYAFPDGNAFIVAPNVFFQIHLSLLASPCPVLAAQLSASAELLGADRPVLRVPDAPSDIRAILGVVYGKLDEEWSDACAVEPGVSVLFRWLRVGTKYSVKALVDRATKELQQVFPTSLDDWDDREGPEARLRFRDEHAIEALNLFQGTGQYDLDIMVPAAVYRCCQLDPAVVRNGTTRADGTPERLSHENIERVARAKALLRERGAQMIEECRENFEQSGSCSFSWGFPDGCAEVISDLGYTKEDGKEAWRAGDPLDNRFSEYVDEQEDGGTYESREDFADCMGACPECIEEVREQLNEMRDCVWNDLPAITGVEEEIGDWSGGV